MKAVPIPTLKEQIGYLEMESEQNEEAFVYIKREFGEKSADLIGAKFRSNARFLKAILISLKELQNLKHFKQ
jgi:hypothetical protein